MFETINHRLFAMLELSPGPNGTWLEIYKILGDWPIFIAPLILVVLWIFGQNPDRQSAVQACVSAFVALSIAGILSALFYHPRPFSDGIALNYLNHLPDSSFPSDHATLLFALSWSFSLRLPPLVPRLWLALFSVAIVVSYSRVALGVHYPADILGAFFVGWFSASILNTRLGRNLIARIQQTVGRIYDSFLDTIWAK